jgi:hypothetical protein
MKIERAQVSTLNGRRRIFTLTWNAFPNLSGSEQEKLILRCCKYKKEGGMVMNNFLKNLLGLQKNDQEIGTLDNDISWEPTPPRTDDILKIRYHGLLKNSGASEIFLHYGFDGWNQSIDTIKMERMEDGSFRAAVKTAGEHEMNFCFKDSVDNWDNNNGKNWTLQLQ